MLKTLFAQMPDMRPVVALVWTVGAKVQVPGSDEWSNLPPHWGVGFYDAHDIPGGHTVVAIDGIPFLFGGKDDHLLNGGTLHYSEGEFRVENQCNLTARC